MASRGDVTPPPSTTGRSIAFSLYDSFAARRFAGNVAGVVVTAEPLPSDLMQAIATELAAPTTGFAVASANVLRDLRYFTPRQEIEACGHVTLAVATELLTLGIWHLEGTQTSHFSVPTRAGSIPVALEGRPGAVFVELTYRPRKVPRSAPGSYGVSLALGARLDPRFPIEIVDTGLRHLVVPLPSPQALAGIQVSHSPIATLAAREGVDTICVFAPIGPLHLRMRDLTAGIGALEEPASGTTAAALALYALRNHLAAAGSSIQIEQGVEMGRPGHIEVTIESSSESGVRVGGQAVKVASGVILANDDLGGPG
jgi:trans-2,3-dihydro-3-hydroxyanthranilate isomerase